MRLALGDVVRDRSDLALGTFVGVVGHTSGRLVALHIPGGGVRLSEPHNVEIVARRVRTTSKRDGMVALLSLVMAGAAAFASCHAAYELGAGWALTFLAGFGAFTAVMTAYRWFLGLTGPRRVRV